MGSIGDLFIRLVADDHGFQSSVVRTAETAGTKAGTAMSQRMAAGLKSARGGLMAGLGIGGGLAIFSSLERAAHLVGDAIGETVDAAKQEQVSLARLNTALKANDTAWDGNSDAIEKVLTSRERLGFTDTDQRNSLALLVAMTKDHSAALNIERVAMDLSRLKGIDLEKASLALGKAYLGNFKALKQLGIQVAAGTTGIEALGIVQQRVAGQAEAFGVTEEGAAQGASAAWENLQETIGNVVLPMLTKFFIFLREDGIPALRGIVEGLAGFGPVLDFIIPGLKALAVLFAARWVTSVGQAAAAMLGLTGATEAASAATTEHVAVETTAVGVTEAATGAVIAHATAESAEAIAVDAASVAVATESIALAEEGVAANAATISTDELVVAEGALAVGAGTAAAALETGAVAATTAGAAGAAAATGMGGLVGTLLGPAGLVFALTIAANAAGKFVDSLRFGKDDAALLDRTAGTVEDALFGIQHALTGRSLINSLKANADEIGITWQALAEEVITANQETGASYEETVAQLLSAARNPEIAQAARLMSLGFNTAAVDIGEAMDIIPPEVQAAADEAGAIVRAVPGGFAALLKDGSTVFFDAAADLTDGLPFATDASVDAAVARVRLAPAELAQSLADGEAEWQKAVEDYGGFVDKNLMPGAERKAIVADLTRFSNVELPKALKSGDQEWITEVEAIISALKDRLFALDNDVPAIATETGVDYATALGETAKVVAANGGKPLTDALRAQLKIDLSTDGKATTSIWAAGIGGTTSVQAVKRAALTARGAVVGVFESVDGIYNAGYTIGSTWVSGMIAALRARRSAFVGEAQWYKNIYGGSLPTEGPLQHPDVGGYSIGESWVGGMIEAITNAIRQRSLLDAVGSVLGGAMPPSGLTLATGAVPSAGAVYGPRVASGGQIGGGTTQIINLNIAGKEPVVSTAQDIAREAARLSTFRVG